MPNPRNVRKKRNDKKDEYSLTKIVIALIILIFIIALIIFGVIKIRNSFLDKKISYERIKYEYFVLYEKLGTSDYVITYN